MLWALKELLELYNADRDEGSYEISYYLRLTVEAEKHIFKVSDAAEDDCCCEKSENLELLLIGIRQAIHKENKDLSKSIPINPETFIAQLVCSAKNFKCCNEECLECPEKAVIDPFKHILKTLPEVSFAKWVVVDSHNNKVELMIVVTA